MSTFRNLAKTAARVLLGLPLVGIPISYFFELGAPPHEGAALELVEALIGSGYFMHFVKGTELVVGVALLANRFVPLALAVLAPIMLNIVAFHVFLEPHSLAFPLVLTALHAYLAVAHRAAYAPLLRARTADVAPRAEPELVAARAE